MIQLEICIELNWQYGSCGAKGLFKLHTYREMQSCNILNPLLLALAPIPSYYPGPGLTSVTKYSSHICFCIQQQMCDEFFVTDVNRVYFITNFWTPFILIFPQDVCLPYQPESIMCSQSVKKVQKIHFQMSHFLERSITSVLKWQPQQLRLFPMNIAIG